MDSYSPASLPPIRSVEVVDLGGIPVNRVSDAMQDARASHVVALEGAEAQRVADLWRTLPPGEQARCHIPPYGLRFHSGERLICEASICWSCNNIYGFQEGKPIHFEFDGQHPTSRELLSIARQTMADAEPD